MEITYKWYIYEMEVYPEYEGYTNYVSKIKWKYTATSEGGQSSFLEGITTYNQTLEPDYIDYFSLTEEIVNSWLDEQNDINELRNKLINSISELSQPTVVTLPLPW